MKTVLTTLSLIYEHPRILLGLKKRGFAAGKWNGFGGKVEIETVEDNIKRETLEECGLVIKDMEKIAIVDFEFEGDPRIIQVHYFRVKEYTGEPVETEEMKPQWFHIDELPYGEMWADDLDWMPLFLQGKKFKGKFWYGQDGKVMAKELTEVDSI